MATSAPAGGMTEHCSTAGRQPQAPETDPALSVCLFILLNAFVKVRESLCLSYNTLLTAYAATVSNMFLVACSLRPILKPTSL